MNNRPFFSVVTPLYNQEDRIKRAIISVLKQSFDDYEYIIIDDGSTDQSYQVAKGFVSVEKKILLFRQSNRGSNYTYKQCINKAKGKYIVILDNDDWLSCDCLKELYHAAITNNLPDIIQVGVSWIKDGKEIEKYSYNNSLYNLTPPPKIEGPFLTTNTRKAVKRHLYDDIEYLGNPAGADTIVNTKLINLAKSFCYVSGVHYYVEIRNESQSHNLSRSIEWKTEMLISYIHCFDWLAKHTNRKKYLFMDDAYEFYRLLLVANSSINSYKKTLKKQLHRTKFANTRSAIASYLSLFFPKIYILIRKAHHPM